jgi:hypothetical protein
MVPANQALDRRLQRQGINKFLSDLYRQERMLSHILGDGGLSPQEIALVQTRIDDYLDGLVHEWTRWFANILQGHEPEIVLRRYGLDGQPTSTLQRLGTKFGVTRERVRQLQKKALGRLRVKTRRQRFEEIVVAEARKVCSISREATGHIPPGSNSESRSSATESHGE